MSPPGPHAASERKHEEGLGLATYLANIYRLTIKELRSIRADPIMLMLIVFAFSIFVYTVATGASIEATNLAVGVADEDQSDLSR